MNRALRLVLVLLGGCTVVGGCIVEVKDPTGPAGAPDADILPVDCGAEEPGTFYRDADGDGFGDPASMVVDCELPAGHTDNGDDCDDDQESVHPSAAELCGDKIDNDCSGVDECEQSLLGHWDFSDAMLDVAADVTGNGHDAALRNGAVVNDAVVQLDGIDDYLEVPHDPTFAIAEGSVSLRFVTQLANTQQGLWSKDSSGQDAGGHLELVVQADNSVQVRLQDAVASHIVSSAPLTVGEQHHLAFTFGAGGMQFYVDGALVASDPFAGGIEANIEPTVFGASTSQSGDGVAIPISSPANASLSDVRLHSRALSALEVAELNAVTTP